MAEIISYNEQLFNQMVEVNPNLSAIQFIQPNAIVYNGHRIDMGSFSLSELLSDYCQLKRDIEVVKPVDLYNIISINSAVSNNKYGIGTQEEAKEQVEEIKKVSPAIKNVQLISKKNELGTERQYVYITTADGVSHILYNNEPKDVQIAFQRIAARNGGSYENITEQDLYYELRRNMNDMTLVDSKDAQSKDYLTSGFKEELQREEQYKSAYGNNNQQRVMGGVDEYGNSVLVHNGEITTYTTDNRGNVVREEHNGGTLSSNESVYQTSESSVSDENLKDDIVEINVSKLISVQEYAYYINKDEPLNEQEQSRVEYFEGFMGELFAYKSYLGDEARQMWNEYERFMAVIAVSDTQSQKQSDSLIQYSTLQEENKVVELQFAKNKALILEKKAEEAKYNSGIAGTVNAIFIVEVTVASMITLAGLIVMFLTR